ncbi:hypothetical protein OCOJLMKI_4060 [Methylobacterium iners]|uniref:NAD-specific glutamate dehydrogenase n=1 Tax=Methylobacterium iners TaxID=418707 RepID=A0ABQ4S184_9HYPH|nr:hypothetical protein OCOJLMKI_4060 [Methylobacterium iners]
MVVEGRVLLGVQHLEERRRRIAAEIHPHLVDLVEQDEWVRGLRLAHRLHDLARHRADIGPAVTADLGLVAHAAERHPHELATRRLSDRLAERGLADAGRTDEAEDRARELVRPLLHGEVLDDALLDLVEAEMVLVEHHLGAGQILLHLRALVPRDAEHPVEVVAHDRGLGRHRRHLPQLLQLGERLLAGLLGELGLLDLVLELGELIPALVVAELLLDRLHLLVQVVLALGLLHLPLDAGPDALLHLEDGDLALHERQHALEALRHSRDLEDRLLVGDLDREVRADRVGELRGLVDLRDGGDDLGRDLLVELHVILELGDDRAGERLRLDAVAELVGERLGLGLVIGVRAAEAGDLGAAGALDEHLHGAVGQLQELQDGGQRADLVDGVGGRIVVARVDLGREQDVAVGPDRLLEGADRLFASDEERHDHVREHDDVAEWQDGVGARRARNDRLARFRLSHVGLPHD